MTVSLISESAEIEEVNTSSSFSLTSSRTISSISKSLPSISITSFCFEISSAVSLFKIFCCSGVCCQLEPGSVFLISVLLQQAFVLNSQFFLFQYYSLLS